MMENLAEEEEKDVRKKQKSSQSSVVEVAEGSEILDEDSDNYDELVSKLLTLSHL
jgi:hypothetical protein